MPARVTGEQREQEASCFIHLLGGATGAAANSPNTRCTRVNSRRDIAQIAKYRVEAGKFRVVYRYTDPDEISAGRNFREAASQTKLPTASVRARRREKRKFAYE